MELEFNLSTLVPMILGQRSHVCISDIVQFLNIRTYLYVNKWTCIVCVLCEHMCMYVCVCMIIFASECPIVIQPVCQSSFTFLTYINFRFS